MSDGWHKGQPQNGERGLKILVLVHLHCSNKPPSTLSKMPGSSGVLESPGCVTQEKFPPIVIVTLAGASTPQPRPGAPPSGYSFIQTGAYCTDVYPGTSGYIQVHPGTSSLRVLFHPDRGRTALRCWKFLEFKRKPWFEHTLNNVQ